LNVTRGRQGVMCLGGSIDESAGMIETCVKYPK